MDKKIFIPAFAVGIVFLAAGVFGAPAGDILLIVGSAFASFAYSAVFFTWRTAKMGPIAAPGAASSPPTGLNAQQQPPTASNVTASGSPTVPGGAEPSPAEVKPPTGKAPRIQLPKSVIENRVPIALLALGLILIVAAVAIYISPQAGLFLFGFIPGVLLLGFGGVLLFLRLYRKEGPVVVEVRRFCMHCGFQMSSNDVSCPRCHRQPPSGVDTKVCPNCGAVIPTLAKFCRDCGAGQPTT